MTPHAESRRAREEGGDLLRAALWSLISTIEATGGAIEDEWGNVFPEADHDWIDLGEAYLAACLALNRQPLVQKFDEALEGPPPEDDMPARRLDSGPHEKGHP